MKFPEHFGLEMSSENFDIKFSFASLQSVDLSLTASQCTVVFFMFTIYTTKDNTWRLVAVIFISKPDFPFTFS
jgi:hypothetical protein